MNVASHSYLSILNIHWALHRTILLQIFHVYRDINENLLFGKDDFYIIGEIARKYAIIK